MATFVGYEVAGLGGELAATIGVFAMPCGLAASAAQQVRRYFHHFLLQGFGRGAAPAVILLGVTALDVGHEAVVSWPGAGLRSRVLVLRTPVHSLVLLAAGALLGWLLAL